MTPRDVKRVRDEIEVLNVRLGNLPESTTPDVPYADSPDIDSIQKQSLELGRALKRLRDKV